MGARPREEVGGKGLVDVVVEDDVLASVMVGVERPVDLRDGVRAGVEEDIVGEQPKAMEGVEEAMEGVEEAGEGVEEVGEGVVAGDEEIDMLPTNSPVFLKSELQVILKPLSVCTIL